MTDWIKQNAVNVTIVLAVVLLLLTAYSSLSSIYFLQQARQISQEPLSVKPRLVVENVSYKINTITNANLFGIENKTKTIAPKRVPKTTLNLKLIGILSADDPRFARAMIQQGRKKVEVYSINERIKGVNAKLQEVRPHEVILNRNGAAESLSIIRDGDKSLRKSSTPPNQTARQKQSA